MVTHWLYCFMTLNTHFRDLYPSIYAWSLLVLRFLWGSPVYVYFFWSFNQLSIDLEKKKVLFWPINLGSQRQGLWFRMWALESGCLNSSLSSLVLCCGLWQVSLYCVFLGYKMRGTLPVTITSVNVCNVLCIAPSLPSVPINYYQYQLYDLGQDT